MVVRVFFNDLLAGNLDGAVKSTEVEKGACFGCGEMVGSVGLAPIPLWYWVVRDGIT